MSLSKLWICLVIVCFWVQAQTTEKHLTFDVASIKPATPPTPMMGPGGRGMIMGKMGPTGGPGTKDPGRITYPMTTVKNLLMIAYDVKSYQISGPPTLDSERFEIQATMPPDTSKEDFKIMLQNLLAERFLLKLHRETKELPMYSLVVGKKGIKMKESAEAPPPDPNAPPPQMPTGPFQPKMGPDGFPILPMPGGGRGGISQIMMPNRARMVGQSQTMQDLVNRLTGMLDRPVTDETGLTAKYDFTLTYSPEGLNSGMVMMGGPPLPPPPPSGGGAVSGGGPANTPEVETPPDLFTAIQAQLGLKLDAKKGPVQMLIIDHVEKAPTEN
jgi:uncharacterized protein (TIGR03435 family)